MKVLRLSTSADVDERIPLAERVPAILESLLTEATGEPVQTVCRISWGSDALPGRVAAWLDEEAPDVLFIWVNAYWYAFSSVQLQMQRRFGDRFGRTVKRAWMRISRTWLVENRLAMRFRRAAFQGVGGRYYFEVEEVLARVRQGVEQALVRGVVPIVYSDGLVSLMRPGHEVHGWSDSRRRQLNARLRQLAAELPAAIVHAPDETPLPPGDDPLAGPDGHPNAAGHAWLAACQLGPHLAAWRQLRAVER